ncbi:MAG: endonuclease/exonuclease/phosphatase family protein [Planctomycetota bacterium]
MKLRTLWLLLVPFAILPCIAPAQESAATQESSAGKGDSLAVMSYNIRYLNNRDGEDVWGNRKEKVYETIHQADLVGLQEVVWKQLDGIRENCPDFEWYAVARDDGKQKGESTPIGWRKNAFELLEKGTFWLSPTPDNVGSKGWDAALPRIASWVRLKHKSTGNSWMILNTHFDHRGKEARKQSAQLIVDWSKKQGTKTPLVVMGDFNASQTSPPYRILASEGLDQPVLQDARGLATKEDSGPAATWNGFRQIGDSRIDHIFCAGKVSVLEFQTLNPKTDKGRFASDHMPVLAMISID